MGEPAKAEVSIKDFRGMGSNYDAKDLPPGLSKIQINVNGFRRGELLVRRGLREITFEAIA